MALQIRLYWYLWEQNRGWPKHEIYTTGYFYQGLEALGITGAKPTGYRFDQYEVDDILINSDVLDIGSNVGFVACYCGQRANSVTGVEINSFLNKIARSVSGYLDLKNVEFIDGDFSSFGSVEKYDVILSLSNHHKIDGNLNMGFEKYIIKIASLLRPEGHLFFKSHNVFAPGNGGLGDDGGMDMKITIMNKYFDIVRYKMVRCFLEHAVEDLDKLFVVARKSNAPNLIDFNLPFARTNYEWTQPAPEN